MLRDWLLPSRTMPRRAWPPVLGVLYIAVVGVLGGLKGYHVLIGLLGFLDLYNERARLFLRAFFPFILTGVVFDSMRYFYWQGIAGRIHTSGPYLLERAWFGIGGRTLNEILRQRHWKALDLLCGLAYLTYVAEYLALAALLFLRGRVDHARTLALCFLVVNLAGFATYFAYPAAPPWYVAQHGLGPAQVGVLPEAAGAVRFDRLIGARLFERIYGDGFAPYGAIPSLHVAYPFMAAVLARRLAPLRWAAVPAALFSLLVCFSAVYLQHHYLLDVLLGIAYGAAAVAIVSAWERRAARPPGG